MDISDFYDKNIRIWQNQYSESKKESGEVGTAHHSKQFTIDTIQDNLLESDNSKKGGKGRLSL